MATTNVCLAAAVGNSFPLLSDLDATTQRLEWLREDRPIGWTTAPANATAAPMKQLQGYTMSLAGRRQGLLGMIELPVRRQIAPILATIRIAKHNLLVQYRARTACDKILPIRRVCKEYRHHLGTAVQVIKGFKQGDQVQSVGHPHFCRHQEHSEYVTGLLTHASDDGVNDCRAITAVRLGNHAPGRNDALRCLGKRCRICREKG